MADGILNPNPEAEQGGAGNQLCPENFTLGFVVLSHTTVSSPDTISWALAE